MNYLKNHLSLILALVSILFSMEVYFIVNKILSNYSQKIANNYTIILVTEQPIKKIELEGVSAIEEIDVEKSLQNLKENLSAFDLNKIKSDLPHFYKLHFSHFPTPDEIRKLVLKLKTLPSVKRIETFRATQNRIYNLLVLANTISGIFMTIILFISFLLILKQMRVWKLEHRERIYIMELFGAPFLLKSGVLLRMAIIDSIISVVLIGIILELIINSSFYQGILTQLGISIDVNISLDLILFFIISVSVSIISTIIVINSKKSENWLDSF